MMTHCLPVSDTSYSYQHGVKIYPVVDAMVVWKVALICRTAMYALCYHQLAHLALGGCPNLPAIEEHRISSPNVLLNVAPLPTPVSRQPSGTPSFQNFSNAPLPAAT